MQGVAEVKAIFPPGTWYNLFDTKKAVISKDDQCVTLNAPLNEVNVHLYQNAILPMQRGGMLTKETRATPFTIIVAFGFGAQQGYAEGKVYVDDDERLEMKLIDGEATLVEFHATVKAKKVNVWSEVEMGKFSLEKGMFIEKINVLGLEGGVGGELEIEVDGERVSDLSGVHFSVSSSSLVNLDKLEEGMKKRSLMVEVGGLALPLGKNFSISWDLDIRIHFIAVHNEMDACDSPQVPQATCANCQLAERTCFPSSPIKSETPSSFFSAFFCVRLFPVCCTWLPLLRKMKRTKADNAPRRASQSYIKPQKKPARFPATSAGENISKDNGRALQTTSLPFPPEAANSCENSLPSPASEVQLGWCSSWELDGWRWGGVEEEKLLGWFPFGEEDFPCFSSENREDPADLFLEDYHDIWHLHHIHEIPTSLDQ
ncbi:Alpha-xylosidase 1 [Apostasia shenzhenica]|uniref:Alpha-xylosidase 1 n=1 Tax=Apostasia shenzhenica TaxID=1088818 RepID=A0A2I0B6W6_9ASPA|nr:Alpha-xylosidase 1 [Apostasia shenzhenica]